MAHRCSLLDGTGCVRLYGSGDDGITKGSEPLGEAWLFAEAIRKGIFENLRYACGNVSLVVGYWDVDIC
jgi:hypothetical protein